MRMTFLKINFYFCLYLILILSSSSCTKSGSFGGRDSATSWDSRTAFPTNQNVSSISNTPSATQICSEDTGGQNVFGVIGVGICQKASGGTNTTAANVLAGTYFWDSTGTSIQGTMSATNWDLTTAFPTGNNVSSIINAPLATQICNAATGGQSVFGVVGVAICQSTTGGTNATAADVLAGTYFWDSTGTSIQGTMVASGSFDTVTASHMYRDIATTQMTLATEKTTSSYASGYREVPDINVDDDGYNSSAIIKAVRPSNTCGTTQNSVAARIADCASQNGADATWNGATKSISGEGQWKLVTKTSGGREVWRDERTGLLWSDSFFNKTWCPSAGSSQTDGSCDGNTQSICVEGATLISAIGEDWTTGVYDNAKGGMGAVATVASPAIRWRLPTKNDFMQADLDGMRYVLPNMSNPIWSATAISYYRANAWTFEPRYGVLSQGGGRGGGDTADVRCIGR